MKLRLIIISSIIFCVGGLPLLFLAATFYFPVLFVIRTDYPAYAKCFMAGGILFLMINVMTSLAYLLIFITNFIFK